MTTTTFAPTVIVDGQVVQPPGWLWILSFALGGCDWAIAEVEKLEFKEKYRAWLKTKQILALDQEIAALEKRLAEAKRMRASL